MKKIFAMLVIMLGLGYGSFAQATPAKKTDSKLKVVKAPEAKQEAKVVSIKPAPAKANPSVAPSANASEKAKAATAKPRPATPAPAAASAPGPVKKDGTPDKRFKANQKLKKDGTPDMRYKQNKK